MEGMEPLTEVVKGPKISALVTMCNQMTEEEWERFKAEDYNKTTGNLDKEDGYNCPICLNRGDICKVKQNDQGCWMHFYRQCKCHEKRNTIRRMQRSGLKNVIKDFTFDKYEAPEAWQQTIKNAAIAYARNPDGWFFIGGQSGAGKSMLCTAICRELLLADKTVVYMPWREDISKIKGLSLDAEERTEMLDRFKNAEILCIDDLFKTADKVDERTGQKTKQRPTTADVTTAFEILNYRCLNPNLLTIISCEWTQDELLDIDEATGSRIFENAGTNGFSISTDRAKNYRLRKTVAL